MLDFNCQRVYELPVKAPTFSSGKTFRFYSFIWLETELYFAFVKSLTEVWATGKVKSNMLAGGHHFTF